MVGGPLRDAGHDVRLLDAECRRMTTAAVVRTVQAFRPGGVMTGHAGSTPAHPGLVARLPPGQAPRPAARTAPTRRSPLAGRVEWLHRAHGVRFITLADENPTTLRDVWGRFLEERAARRLPVRLFATIRATDIVRDADLLPLYRRAGILYVLMGIESTDGEVLKQINKGSTTRDDFRACQLLKQHGIFSILGHIVGFRD